MRITFFTLAAMLAACESATGPAAPVSTLTPPAVAVERVAPSPSDLAAQEGGQVVAVDEAGLPRLIVATRRLEAKSADAATAAREHLGRFLAAQRVDASALSPATGGSGRERGGGGRLVHLRQQLEGAEVWGSDVKVLMKLDASLVAISGALKAPAAERSGFQLGAEAVVARAVADRLGFEVGANQVRPAGERAGWLLVRVDGEGLATLDEPAHVRPIWVSEGRVLRPAWLLEFMAATSYGAEKEGFRAVVSATDGRILERARLTAYDTYTYRVWAEPTTKRPYDGPVVDFTPHPTGVPDRQRPAFVPANLVAVEGLNAPNDPWLPSGATETAGNNIDAYSDVVLPDGYTNGDLRATTTSARTFDRTYDVNASPLNGNAVATTQLMASIAEAFYVTNWLHDYWYDRGFDEQAGNNQLDNYGRGGFGGDPMHVEVQDRALATPAQRNNANMSTPSDGFAPRMQIFLWTGYSSRNLETTLAPGAPVGTGVAAFGPTNFTASAELVYAQPANGCTALTNAAQVAGKIVLVDRGTCTFKTKTLAAQNAGAVAVLLANNAAGAAPGLADDATITTPITIGTLSVSQADGNTLKAGLMAGTVTVTAMSRFTAPDADGALDNAVVAHEYGHFLHHRLQSCGTDQCGGMSEGWGDFVSLHMMLREGDNLDGTFADSSYAGMGGSIDGAYFGIRRYPYSTDLTRSPLTFKYVGEGAGPLPAGVPTNPASSVLSEVHNAGEIWAQTLFDAYVALQKARPATVSFDVVRHQFAKDLTTALQVAPRDSTYTEMRDAILATLSARSVADRDIVAAAFARRGMGTCAVPPARFATEGAMPGVVESMTLAPNLTLGSVSLDDATLSCDSDGVLDADETGVLHLRVSNAGPLAATGTQVTVTSTTMGITIADGGTVTVPSIAPYATVDVPVAVQLAGSVTMPLAATLEVSVANAAACTPMLTTQLIARLNTDEVPASSATDDAEAKQAASTPTGALAAQVWSRATDEAPNHVWHGADLGEQSDTALETPALQVAATGNFVVTFSHKYSFEFGDNGMGQDVGWDGAVIELQEAGGAWVDVSTFTGVTPGYGGTLFNPVNPLGTTRQVYLHQNAAWPAMDTVTLDFGTQLASKSVKLRFRIGTDAAAGDEGWSLDDIRFAGITNTPFTGVVTDTHFCNRPPVANAGADRTVSRGAAVLLDASASTDPDADPLTFTWAQVSGPAVTLQGTSGRLTGFTAPAATAMDQVLTFRLTASDGKVSATDTVDITVSANQAPVANAGMAQTVRFGAAVVLDGSGSTDAEGDALTYTWTQTGGANVTLAGGSRAVATFTAPVAAAEAMLTFSLKVSDGLAESTATVVITVGANRAPVAMAALVSGLLDASGSTDPDGDALTFAWTQTSGPAAQLTNTVRSVTGFTAPEVTEAATLVFQVTVSDGHSTSTATVDVPVQANQGPTASAGPDATVESAAPVILKGSGSDPEGKPLRFQWKQTGGMNVSLEDPVEQVTTFVAPTVSESVELTFQLTVTDDHQKTATDSVTLTVNPAKKGCGCDAGAGSLGLLALAALVMRRKKTPSPLAGRGRG